MYTINGYLYHHGIMGQRWGVRNGPPYPLSEGAHSKSEQKAGYKKSIKKGKEDKVNKNKQGIMAETITMALCYTAMIATPLIAYAIQVGKEHADTKKAQKKLDAMRSERSSKVDPKTGLPMKTTKMTPEEDLKHVNPLHDNHTMAVNQNCVLCTVAYEMRRRGYDVNANLTAKPLAGWEMYKKMFPGAKQTTIETNSKDFLDKDSKPDNLKIDPKKYTEFTNYARKASVGENREHAKAIINEMRKQPNSRGAIGVVWGVGGGHMMAYEIKNGEFMIRDGQCGKTFTGKELEDLLASTVICNYQRFDNVEPDYSKIKEAVG